MFPPATVVPLTDAPKTISEIEIKIEHHLRYVAIAHYKISSDDGQQELVIDNCFIDEDVDGNRYQDFIIWKLRNLPTDKNFMSIFQSQLGSWYVKSYKKVVYIVSTSETYPNDVAIECIDELYETARTIKGNKWPKFKTNSTTEKKKMELDACCHGIALKYGPLDDYSAAHTIITQVDPKVRQTYSQRIMELIDENIQDESAAVILEEKKNQCIESAKEYKKGTNKLKWIKNRKGIVVGTTILSIAGGIGGFLIGGPAGAGVLTSITSVAAAQAIEASAGAAVCAVTFLGASSAYDSWFWNQRFISV